jgi:hypothetical protein
MGPLASSRLVRTHRITITFVLPGEGSDSSPSRFKPGEEADIWRTFSGKVKVELPASTRDTLLEKIRNRAKASSPNEIWIEFFRNVLRNYSV